MPLEGSELMPTNVVKTPADEKKWQKAKARAKEQGKAENYAYIMGIYKQMNPERFKSAQRVAARYAAQLPLMDPLYNLREAAKELLLLEDHLGHAQKHCPDCIRKHLLTTEALLEEAVRLDTEGEMLGLLSPLPAQVRELWTAYQDGRPEHEIGQAARVLRKGLVEASAAVRVAARKGPPMQMGSAAMLKRQGLIPVDVFFGEARPHKRPIIELGDGLQDRRGKLHFFVGVDERGKAILADTMDKAKRLHRKVIQDRKHHTTAKNVAARFQLKQAKPEKALYTAVFLDDPDALKRWWVEETGIPLLPKHYAHHMTIKYRPDAKEVVDLPIGKRAPLRIVGWAADAKGQAVKVESSVRSTKKIAHVTVATDGTRPVYSNKLLATGIEPASGTLKGRVGYKSTDLLRHKPVFDLSGTIYEALSKMGPRKAMLPEQVTDERDHDVRRDDPEDGGGSVLPGSEEEE